MQEIYSWFVCSNLLSPVSANIQNFTPKCYIFKKNTQKYVLCTIDFCFDVIQVFKNFIFRKMSQNIKISSLNVL